MCYGRKIRVRDGVREGQTERKKRERERGECRGAERTTQCCIAVAEPTNVAAV